mmetsp:Transcript_32310/g.39756  ORF Transcript_32310/g.39756 Transcript_32310/m.39756 type:complete len:93 (-) Transcript_32310:105-383(-)
MMLAASESRSLGFSCLALTRTRTAGYGIGSRLQSLVCIRTHTGTQIRKQTTAFVATHGPAPEPFESQWRKKKFHTQPRAADQVVTIITYVYH